MGKQSFGQTTGPASGSGSPHFSISELTVSAMLVALGIVLSFVRIPLSQVTEITLTGLPIALGGYLFGPLTGFVIGALVDGGGCLIAPKGPYFPGFTLSSGLIGLIYGLLLYRGVWERNLQNRRRRIRATASSYRQDEKHGDHIQEDYRQSNHRRQVEKNQGTARLLRAGAKGLAVRVVLAHFLKTLLISLLLSCFWLSVFYGMPFKAVFLMSLPKELINFPIEAFLIYSMVRISARLPLGI